MEILFFKICFLALSTQILSHQIFYGSFCPPWAITKSFQWYNKKEMKELVPTCCIHHKTLIQVNTWSTYTLSLSFDKIRSVEAKIRYFEFDHIRVSEEKGIFSKVREITFKWSSSKGHISASTEWIRSNEGSFDF